MDDFELDRIRQAYKETVEKWIAAIRREEVLATPDHSIGAWDRWDHAHFAEEHVRKEALAARERYVAGLREIDYGF